MATQAYPSFDSDIINQSLEAAQQHGQTLRAGLTDDAAQLTDGALLVGAQCVSITVQNHQVCINLPLGIGSKCFSVPSWVPDGAAVRACLDICTKWGIPCGVQLTVTFNDALVFRQGFGCSC